MVHINRTCLFGIPSFIENLNSLKTLSCFQNEIISLLFMYSFKGNTSSWKQNQDNPWRSWKSKLILLDLNCNSVVPLSIGRWTNLRQLLLNYNSIEEIPSLINCSNCFNFHIERNKLSSFPFLEQFSQITELDIGVNPFSNFLLEFPLHFYNTESIQFP